MLWCGRRRLLAKVARQGASAGVPRPVELERRLAALGGGEVAEVWSGAAVTCVMSAAHSESPATLRAEDRAAAAHAPGGDARPSVVPEAAWRLAAIVESSQDAIIGKTLEGVITDWNTGAGRIFGYAASEIVGRPVTVLVPPDRMGEEEAILARLRQGHRVETFETVRVRKDGVRIDVAQTTSPIRDPSGNMVGAATISRDVTARKQSEEALHQRTLELARMAAALKRSNEELDQFAYITSHDLKAPLRGIANLSRWIEEDMGPAFTPEAHQQDRAEKDAALRRHEELWGTRPA